MKQIIFFFNLIFLSLFSLCAAEISNTALAELHLYSEKIILKLHIPENSLKQIMNIDLKKDKIKNFQQIETYFKTNKQKLNRFLKKHISFKKNNTLLDLNVEGINHQYKGNLSCIISFIDNENSKLDSFSFTYDYPQDSTSYDQLPVKIFNHLKSKSNLLPQTTFLHSSKKTLSWTSDFYETVNTYNVTYKFYWNFLLIFFGAIIIFTTSLFSKTGNNHDKNY